MKLLKSRITLNKLYRKSNKAVSIIRTTIEKLKAANSMIEEERTRNIDRIANLKSTNNSLDELQTDNEKIIAKFEALLS